MFRRSSESEAGFTLIEALVALAIVAVVLGSIGRVIGATVKGTWAIDQRLALSGVAETLLTELPTRQALKPGRQSGELAGYRWRIDVAPMKAGDASEAEQSRFIPLTVNLSLQAQGGASLQMTTVRLVPKVVQ